MTVTDFSSEADYVPVYPASWGLSEQPALGYVAGYANYEAVRRWGITPAHAIRRWRRGRRRQERKERRIEQMKGRDKR